MCSGATGKTPTCGFLLLRDRSLTWLWLCPRFFKKKKVCIEVVRNRGDTRAKGTTALSTWCRCGHTSPERIPGGGRRESTRRAVKRRQQLRGGETKFDVDFAVDEFRVDAF